MGRFGYGRILPGKNSSESFWTLEKSTSTSSTPASCRACIACSYVEFDCGHTFGWDAAGTTVSSSGKLRHASRLHICSNSQRLRLQHCIPVFMHSLPEHSHLTAPAAFSTSLRVPHVMLQSSLESLARATQWSNPAGDGLQQGCQSLSTFHSSSSLEGLAGMAGKTQALPCSTPDGPLNLFTIFTC